MVHVYKFMFYSVQVVFLRSSEHSTSGLVYIVCYPNVDYIDECKISWFCHENDKRYKNIFCFVFSEYWWNFRYIIIWIFIFTDIILPYFQISQLGRETLKVLKFNQPCEVNLANLIAETEPYIFFYYNNDCFPLWLWLINISNKIL